MDFEKHNKKMQKGLYALFCIFVNFSSSSSQTIFNNVNNYSFENFNACPIGNDNIKNSDYWFKATIASSPDYFNSCSSSSFAGVPVNVYGSQSPKTGNGYAGFFTYSEIVPNAREYIENGLKNTLQLGKVYCVTMYVSSAENLRFASNNIGFLFSNDSIREYAPTWPPYTLTYTPNYFSTNVVVDTINWTLIQSLYTANGTEKFITIGNFKDDASTTYVPYKPYISGSPNNTAYYFIDDVSVIEINPANASIKDSLISYCVLDSVILGTDSTEFATYQWQSTAAGLAALSCTDCPNPIAKPAVTTKYYLTKQQCSATTMDSVTVVVLTPTTQANAGQDKVICLGESIQIGTGDSLKFTSYNWQFSGSLNCTNCALPVANPTVSTTYTVQRTECATVTTDTVRVIVDDCDPTYIIPNVFTPNYDDVNDTWGINFSTVNSRIKNFKMNIYDRWGLEVYSTNHELNTPNSKWDGHTNSGVECSPGVYYYIITFEKNGEHILLKGHVSLFR